MRSLRIRFVASVGLLATLVGCELIAGLEDHQLTSDTSSADGATDGNNGEASSTAPAFTIANVPTLTLQQGGSAAVDVTITRVNGFSDAVSITVSGLPAGATTTPLSITADQSTGTFTIALASTTPQSVSHLSINGATVDGKTSSSAKMDLIARGPAGSIDLLYGNQGFFENGTFNAVGAALDAKDNLIVVGNVGTPAIALGTLRATSNGILDTTFAQLSQPFDNLFPYGFGSVLPLTSGGVVFGGNVNDLGELVRVTAAGVLDRTYSPDGGVGYGDTKPYTAFAVDATGRVLVGSTAPSGGHQQIVIERHLPNGALDSSFSSAPHQVGSGDAQITQIIVLPDGKILTASNATDSITGFALNRFTDTGAVDTTFGFSSSGYFPPIVDGGARDLRVAADGTIYALSSNSQLVHLQANGGTINTFALNGVASTPNATSIAVQSDGKVIAAGTISQAGDAGPYTVLQVERIDTAGNPDTTFGNAGFVTTAHGGVQAGGISALRSLVQSDGRILVVGETAVNPDIDAFNITAVCYWP